MVLQFDIFGENPFIILLIVLGIVAAGVLYFLITEKPWLKNKQQKKPAANTQNISLRLAAYERLILFVERMSLPNVISRVNIPGASCEEMQLYITQSIKQEYDYNLSQQIYVSNGVWHAVSMLKDQNMLIVNQVAATLPPGASGFDLNKKILEFAAGSEIGALQSKISEAINIEARQVMGS
jgi:hypothetical protein